MFYSISFSLCSRFGGHRVPVGFPKQFTKYEIFLIFVLRNEIMIIIVSSNEIVLFFVT
jgi:hypothetical protein